MKETLAPGFMLRNETLAGNMTDSEYYWNMRADNSYKYKGECFYTLTPIPYYYSRRRILLKLLGREIKKINKGKILDFGCGDGFYLKYFTTLYIHKASR
jgi:2-polyprenyl-3-methyl-5-hydroxy-6-metoxy-1,4-benzoquinol methylase